MSSESSDNLFIQTRILDKPTISGVFISTYSSSSRHTVRLYSMGRCLTLSLVSVMRFGIDSIRSSTPVYVDVTSLGESTYREYRISKHYYASTHLLVYSKSDDIRSQCALLCYNVTCFLTSFTCLIFDCRSITSRCIHQWLHGVHQNDTKSSMHCT